MAENTDARIAQLEAENAALRAAQSASRGPLHPDVQPALMNGSVVLYDGEPHRITGRSIDWDGNATYTVLPVTGTVVHVHGPLGAQRVDRYALDHDLAHADLDGIRTYDLAHPEDAEPVFEVPEADLEAFHEHDTYAFAVADEARRHARQRGEGVAATEGASIVRE
jgi:hypothetical protein